ncbi:unnamed protein product, partial [Rotaria magnacalcarata]
MEKLRYVCVAKELGSIDTIRRIHIQIIKWKNIRLWTFHRRIC